MLKIRTKFFIAFLLTALTADVSANEFDTWLTGLEIEATEAGISKPTVQTTMQHIELLPNIIKLDLAQPEFISPFLDYYYKRVDAAKINRGRELMLLHEQLLAKLEAQYGVPPSILIAFWGMETNYGNFKGNIDTFSSLATLAYDGRRASFFRNQLFDAMRLVDEGYVEIGTLQGSWAGAFGHMQFMPTTMLTYAVDGDGDKQIDIVHSEADALASAANYLSQAGWRKGEPAMLEVQLPNDFKWQDARLILRKSLKEWQRLDVQLPTETLTGELTQSAASPSNIAATQIKPASKRTKKKKLISKRSALKSKPAVTLAAKPPKPEWPQVDGDTAILLPQGWRGPAFMVFDNFDVIMDWNRSVNYALSVAQLAKRLDGESRIIGGQFAESGGLTFEQMFELQTALNELKFVAGEPDGFPGLQTQAAIRNYQLEHRLPADGYASPSLYDHLMQQNRYDESEAAVLQSEIDDFSVSKTNR